MARIDELFRYLIETKGSDLHLSEGQPPKIRVHGAVVNIPDREVLKVLHAPTQDLEIFFYRVRQAPQGIFDTQLAAAMHGLGAQIGYSTLIERLFGVWQDRPVGHEMARPVVPLAIVENGFHRPSMRLSSAWPVRTMFVSPLCAVKPSRS